MATRATPRQAKRGAVKAAVPRARVALGRSAASAVLLRVAREHLPRSAVPAQARPRRKADKPERRQSSRKR